MSLNRSELEDLCNPDRYSFTAALSLGRKYAGRIGTFYLGLADFVRILCAATPIEFKMIDRTLEILIHLAPARITCEALRHVFGSPSAKLRSRVMKNLESQDSELLLPNKLMDDADHRVRANVVEALWPVVSPAAQRLFVSATRDTHHRVAANGAYGLYLLQGMTAMPSVETLVQHRIPAFRSAAAWLIRKAGNQTLSPLLKTLLTDENAGVRKAAIKSQLELKLKAVSG